MLFFVLRFSSSHFRIIARSFLNHVGSLSLPKLGLQFLTVADYLKRNFDLFRLESSYEIRGDLEETLPRLKPVRNVGYDADSSLPSFGSYGTAFGGWARMSLPLQSFNVIEVQYIYYKLSEEKRCSF